jgi:hypothetical protein
MEIMISGLFSKSKDEVFWQMMCLMFFIICQKRSFFLFLQAKQAQFCVYKLEFIEKIKKGVLAQDLNGPNFYKGPNGVSY